MDNTHQALLEQIEINKRLAQPTEKVEPKRVKRPAQKQVAKAKRP